MCVCVCYDGNVPTSNSPDYNTYKYNLEGISSIMRTHLLSFSSRNCCKINISVVCRFDNCNYVYAQTSLRINNNFLLKFSYINDQLNGYVYTLIRRHISCKYTDGQ